MTTSPPRAVTVRIVPEADDDVVACCLLLQCSTDADVAAMATRLVRHRRQRRGKQLRRSLVDDNEEGTSNNMDDADDRVGSPSMAATNNTAMSGSISTSSPSPQPAEASSAFADALGGRRVVAAAAVYVAMKFHGSPWSLDDVAKAAVLAGDAEAQESELAVDDAVGQLMRAEMALLARAEFRLCA